MILTIALFVLELVALASSIITLIKVYNSYEPDKINKDLIYQAMISGIVTVLASIVVEQILLITQLSLIVLIVSQAIYYIIGFIQIIAFIIVLYYAIKVVSKSKA